MSIFNKAKRLIAGNKTKTNQAIDKVADAVQSKTPDSVDEKVETVADKAKKAVNKLKK